MRDTKRPIHCLIVSDNELLLQQVQDLLTAGTRALYEITVARNIDEALEQLTNETCEVCMVDYLLQDSAGCDLVRRCQLQGVTTPVIMFTESEDDAVDIEAVMAGASDLVPMDELSGSLLERTVHIAMVRSMADSRLRRMATRDHLTRVFNRAHFERFASTELLRANRCGQKASLMFIDVDKFKAVNDTLGHSAGDDMLKTVAQVCQNEVRAIDCVGRFGGDEFVILLMQTGIEGAGMVAERIRTSIDGAILHSERDAVPVSVSVGIASSEQGFATYTPMFDAADTAARTAKHRGRNCVVAWSNTLASELEEAKPENRQAAKS